MEAPIATLYYTTVLHCDLTLPTPAENLACDEALLAACESGAADSVLRLWEPTGHFVVLGYANQAAREANLDFCRWKGIPVLRRCSGGGTVLQGPGCLNYALILSSQAGPCGSISSANEFIMRRHQAALAELLQRPVERRGHTDLAIGGLKFSGNAQRRHDRWLLFHGSFLLHFDLELIESALPMPSRQPDYRLGRPHDAFLMNLEIRAHLLKAALIKAWEALHPLTKTPLEEVRRLVRDKYTNDAWNLKF